MWRGGEGECGGEGRGGEGRGERRRLIGGTTASHTNTTTNQCSLLCITGRTLTR